MGSVKLKIVVGISVALLLSGCAQSEVAPKQEPPTKPPAQTQEPVDPVTPEPAPEAVAVDNFYDLCVAELTKHEFLRSEDPVRTIASEADALIVQREDGVVILAADGANENGPRTLMCGARGTVAEPEWLQFGESLPMTDEQVQERIRTIGPESA